jgi:hypothetical protein
MHVRGLSLTEVARRSGVAVATASSAALGRPVNVTTALRVARAVAAQPVIPELLEWVERPQPWEVGLGDAHAEARAADAAVVTAPAATHRAAGRPAIARSRSRWTSTNTAGQMDMAVD